MITLGLMQMGFLFFRVPVGSLTFADCVWSHSHSIVSEKEDLGCFISVHYHVILIILHRMFKARASRCRPPQKKLRILNFNQAPHGTNTSSCPLLGMCQRFVIPVRNQKLQCLSDTFALFSGWREKKKAVQLRQGLFTLALVLIPQQLAF